MYWRDTLKLVIVLVLFSSFGHIAFADVIYQQTDKSAVSPSFPEVNQGTQADIVATGSGFLNSLRFNFDESGNDKYGNSGGYCGTSNPPSTYQTTVVSVNGGPAVFYIPHGFEEDGIVTSEEIINGDCNYFLDNGYNAPFVNVGDHIKIFMNGIRKVKGSSGGATSSWGEISSGPEFTANGAFLDFGDVYVIMSTEGLPPVKLECDTFINNTCNTTIFFQYSEMSAYAGTFPDTSQQLLHIGPGSFATNQIPVASFAQNYWWKFVKGAKTYYLNVKYSNGVWTPGDVESCVTDCFSNVLFLPGIEASRLYKLRSGGSEDQLWEPNTLSDVEDLYLNSDGASINPDIYTKDIINESNTPIPTGQAGQNIYKKFSETMGELIDEFKIIEWKPYSYDWRRNVVDIVNNGTKTEEGTVTLTDTLQSLVDSSKSGKVTIIAHSNGGLLAKAFLQKLQKDKEQGINNLIDDVDVLILVAVPEIGTASAVPAMIHGYDQQILDGLLLDNMHARELGINMPGAYGLLPSREYINRVSASPITFFDYAIPSNITTKLVQTFGSAISSYGEYKSFLFGGEGRPNPLSTETNLPISLSQNLFLEAENLHDRIDAWAPPSNLRVIEIAGWGLDTVASFEYYPISCGTSDVSCYKLDERPRFTSDGDGTVVVTSAQYMSLNNFDKYWIDLPKHNKQLPLGLRRNRKHASILEVNSLENFIKSIIEKNSTFVDSVLKDSEPMDASNRLRLSIHSPVDINAYNESGEHTGKICSQFSDFCYVQEDIPNSSYLEFGEGKYLNLPEDEAKSIKLQGTGIGTFTYYSEKVLPDGTSTISSFVDIPVTTQTQGEVTLNNGVPQLKLDVTGDGVADITLTPNPTFDPITYLRVMKATIDSLDISKDKIKAFDKRVDDMIKLIQSNKVSKAKLSVDKFKSALNKVISTPDPKKPKQQKISKTDAQLLLDMLNKLLDNLS